MTNGRKLVTTRTHDPLPADGLFARLSATRP